MEKKSLKPSGNTDLCVGLFSFHQFQLFLSICERTRNTFRFLVSIKTGQRDVVLFSAWRKKELLFIAEMIRSKNFEDLIKIYSEIIECLETIIMYDG